MQWQHAKQRLWYVLIFPMLMHSIVRHISLELFYFNGIEICKPLSYITHTTYIQPNLFRLGCLSFANFVHCSPYNLIESCWWRLTPDKLLRDRGYDMYGSRLYVSSTQTMWDMLNTGTKKINKPGSFPLMSKHMSLFAIKLQSRFSLTSYSVFVFITNGAVNHKR